jgi:Phospholipase_D-nuclease N-terminal/Short C-terminal domain
VSDVVIAADYPFLDILWSMIIFFSWVIWIWIAITVLMDVFRRKDISGWGKAAWVVFVIILPFLGVLVYLIANHDGMTERSTKEAQGQQEQFDQYVRSVADSGGAAGEIDKAKQLLDSGAINQQEFDRLKAKALA